MSLDSLNMRKLVEQFPAQLDEALHIARAATLRNPKSTIQNVLISGLGGSGIGGTIVSELASASAKVPISVTKGYFIPEFVGANTLVIVSSYSGNTEETLACYEQAYQRGAHIVCITSGGQIAEKAKEWGHDLILIPGGMPPRACLGYSFVQLLRIFSANALLPANALEQVNLSIISLKNNQQKITQEAVQIAEQLYGKIPIIYCTTSFEGVAIRFRQQINENSKMLCWHHVIPEMNHNELVAWAGGDQRFAVVLLRDPQEYIRNDYRISINKEIIRKKTDSFIEVFAQGTGVIEKVLWLIHLGDWVSVELADKNGVDAIEVNVISYLKGELSKK